MRKILQWLTGNRWRAVSDGRTWGIYHPVLWHRWSYGLPKDQAKRECCFRNEGVTECCKDCGYTYASHVNGMLGGIDCP